MAKNRKQALGRGFDGLIPVDIDINGVASPGEQICQMAMIKLVANPDQPRREFDDTALQGLAESIKLHGIIQPLVVTPHGDGRYRIVAGERRLRAAKLAGLKELPVIIRNHKELEELEIALVENVQRVDLSPLEQALSIIKLRDQFNLSIKVISKKLGKAETTVSNILRLLKLPKEAIQKLQDKSISEGHARAILALNADLIAQKELLKDIVLHGLSVREAEEYVRSHKAQILRKKVKLSKQATQALEGVSKELSSRIKIRETSSTRGNLRIKYSSPSELQGILDRLDKK